MRAHIHKRCRCRSLHFQLLVWLLACVGLWVASAAEVRAEGQIEWVATVGSAERDSLSLYQLAVAADGSVYAAGTIFSSQEVGTSYLPVLVKLDASGQVAWLVTIAESDYAILSGLGVDGGGVIHVAGTLFGAADSQPFHATFSGDGERQSLRTFAEAQLPYLLDMAVNWSGQVYLVGTDAAREVHRMWFTKLNNRASIEWTRRFGQGAGDEIIAVASVRGGDVVVCGREGDNIEGMTRAWLARYRWNGERVWKRSVSAEGPLSACYDLAVPEGGAIIAGGETCDDGGCRFGVVRLNGEGEVLWLQPAGDSLVAADWRGGTYALAADVPSELVRYSTVGLPTWRVALPSVPLALRGSANAAYAAGTTADGTSWVARIGNNAR